MASLIRFCLFSLILASQAMACSGCFGGQSEQVQDAYIYITILLSVVPLIAITVFIFWWRKRAKKLQLLESQNNQNNQNNSNDSEIKDA